MCLHGSGWCDCKGGRCRRPGTWRVPRGSARFAHETTGTGTGACSNPRPSRSCAHPRLSAADKRYCCLQSAPLGTRRSLQRGCVCFHGFRFYLRSRRLQLQLLVLRTTNTATWCQRLDAGTCDTPPRHLELLALPRCELFLEQLLLPLLFLPLLPGQLGCGLFVLVQNGRRRAWRQSLTGTGCVAALFVAGVHSLQSPAGQGKSACWRQPMATTTARRTAMYLSYCM